MSNSREKILSKIRQALTTRVPVPFVSTNADKEIFEAEKDDLELKFAENFSQLQGKFVYCGSEEELVANLNELAAVRKWDNIYCVEDALKESLQNNGFSNLSSTDLKSCDASITTCEALVARTGSILLSSEGQSGRTVSVYAPVHICIAYTSQLVFDIKDGLQLLKTKYKGNLPSLISLATGPSRTADIEKTLVVGVHGPKEVFCFLIEG